MPLVVRSLSDQIYDVLRQRIVLHDIAPGEMIRQDAIASELGTSKIPVREALARLAGSGLVTSSANKGFVATPLSAKEADDIFSLRALIEPPTAAATALEAKDAARADVAKALDELLTGKPDFRASMDRRRRMGMSMVFRDSHPTRNVLIVQLFDRAERYHPVDGNTDFIDVEGIKELVAAWLDRDAAGVHRLYQVRLASRAKLVRDALGQ